jgi:large subunit ribosomal protein L10e
MKGVNYRETRGMPYVRREYIAGKPQLKIARFSSGLAGNNYDYKIELIATEKLQIRHNALEAARLAANKRMAQAGETSFFSMLRVYPHVLLRENKMIATAGADRLQEGMRRAFGKSTGLAARIRPGQVIFEAYGRKQDWTPHDYQDNAIKRASIGNSGRLGHIFSVNLLISSELHTLALPAMLLHISAIMLSVSVFIALPSEESGFSTSALTLV